MILFHFSGSARIRAALGIKTYKDNCKKENNALRCKGCETYKILIKAPVGPDSDDKDKRDNE